MIPALAAAIPSLIGALAPLLSEAIPDLDKRRELTAEAERRLSEMVTQITVAQLDVNKAEAQHASLFVAGWRPAIGWCCAFALFYATFGRDLLNYLIGAAFLASGIEAPPPLPSFDTGLLFELTMAMLGMSGLRTWEKMKGVASVTLRPETGFGAEVAPTPIVPRPTGKPKSLRGALR